MHQYGEGGGPPAETIFITHTLAPRLEAPGTSQLKYTRAHRAGNLLL